MMQLAEHVATVVEAACCNTPSMMPDIAGQILSILIRSLEDLQPLKDGPSVNGTGFMALLLAGSKTLQPKLSSGATVHRILGMMS
jgi:hypothetical protein